MNTLISKFKFHLAVPCAFLLLLMSGCKVKQPVKSTSNMLDGTGELIFQSGFEAGSRIISQGNDSDIIGRDSSVSEKSDWQKDLEKNAGIGNFCIQYTGGDISKRYAAIIPEPANPGNKVLQFCIRDWWLASEGQQKARVQCDIYGIKPGYKEFYQSIRVFFPEDMKALRKYPDKINWLTISEFWNNEWWVSTEKYGFRVTLGIGKPTSAESDLYFILNAENAGQKEVWNAKDEKIKVPIGKWFTMDYYYKEGNNETGRFYLSIQSDGEAKQVVFDVKGYTQNTTDPHPNGITGYNPMKLYTSKDVVNFMKAQGKSLQVYWDDFKLWKNKRPQ